MKNYLFGISGFCSRVTESGVIPMEQIHGLFDNDILKVGTVSYGLRIESPRYIDGVEVVITVASEEYRIEAVRQLLYLGYTECTMVYESDGIYEKKTYDFSNYFHPQDKSCLILLYLQHRSYSGISAIAYMIKNGIVSLPSGFRVATITNVEDRAKYYYYASMADYVITERDYLRVYGKLIQLWHGFPLKSLGHMMKSFNPERNITTNKWACYNYIASYGQMYTNFMCACYGTPSSQYWVTGMPRNDLLFITDGKKNFHEIMPDSMGKKLILYMPTFRELEHKAASYMQVDGDEDAYLFYWDDFNISRLEKFCIKENVYFVFKLHPSDASKVKSWYADSEHIGILTDDMLGEKCMYEYLNAADLLITDYSSVYFDYLLLNRPIVFTDKDIETYAARRGLMLEPLDFWRPGAAVHTMDMLEKEIADGLRGGDRYVEQRKVLSTLVHRHQDGRSTERLFEMIKRDLESNNA